MARQTHAAATSTKNRVAATVAAPAVVTLDTARRLYNVPCGKGWSCLGFDYAEQRRVAVLAWMGLPPYRDCDVGTVAAYEAYAEAMRLGSRHAAVNAKRCPAELTPQLIGLEGQRVEVVDSYGEKRRFTVGKSTGWMPCHVEIKTARSTGGAAVTGAPFASVRVL